MFVVGVNTIINSLLITAMPYILSTKFLVSAAVAMVRQGYSGVAGRVTC